MQPSETTKERPSFRPPTSSVSENVGGWLIKARGFTIGAALELFGLAIILFGLASGSVNWYAIGFVATLVYTPNLTTCAIGLVVTFIGLLLHILMVALMGGVGGERR
jgi:hypothetical protein